MIPDHVRGVLQTQLRGALGLSDSHLQALGALVAAFGQLEVTLYFHHATKAGESTDDADLRLPDVQFSRLLKAFTKLVRAEFPDGDVRADFDAWRARAEALSKQRSRAVHVAWMRDQPDHRLVRADRREQVDGGIPVEFTDVASLELQAIEALALARGLVQLGERIGSTVYSDDA